MRNKKIFVFSILLCLLPSFVYGATTLSYNRDKAKIYAEKYCQNYNTQDENNTKDIAYTSYPKDCANFMSQALIQGGLDFSCLKGKGVDSIGTGKKNKGQKGVIQAKLLLKVLQESFCFEVVDNSKAKAGDIVGSSSHVMMVADPDPTLRYFYAHTKDVCSGDEVCGETNDQLCQYSLSNTILQFNSNKCRKCEFNEKTCKARIKDKCEGCSTCDPSTGVCKSGCGSQPVGRCTPGSMCKCFEIDGEKECSCINTGPSGDCPDDTITVASQPQTGEVLDTDSTSSVGVLDVGYTYDMQKLLSSFGEDVRTLLPSEVSPSLAINMPLLIIPTGGLQGMENSAFFKVVLDEYVKQGGSILVLAQQHGYEFSILPTPTKADGTTAPITGYGWAEDQSCQSNSSYIDTWHNVLAGQTQSTPSLNVDGYFTSYPDNTTVLLRRTANGQPAVILYPYGNGYIIATTIYTDWAYSTGQASEDERRLIRDIVSWLVKPAALQEIKPVQDVTVALSLTNNDTTETATAVEIEILDPDRKERKLWESIPVTLAPGQSTQLPVTYTATSTDPLGIYHIKYNLMSEGYQLLTSELDPEGTNVWLPYQLQPPTEEPSGRFVVSNPPQAGYQESGITFSVQSDSEWYLIGSTATFVINIWNNTDTEKTVTAKYENGQSQTITISPKRLGRIIYNKVIENAWGRVQVSFFDETSGYPKALGTTFRGYYGVYPSALQTVSTDKPLYAKGETIAINTSLKNTTTAIINIESGHVGYDYYIIPWQADVKVTITDLENTKVFEDTKTVSLSSNGTSSVVTSVTLPATLLIGTYTVRVEVRYGDRLIRSASTTFEFPQSEISVIPNLPSVFITGTNTIFFALNNTGKINVSSGIIDISLKDPGGNVVYSGSQPFAIGVGENKILNIPISIPALKLGNYILTYTQSDETRQGQPATLIIYNSINITSLSFDKSSYRIRDTANLTTAISNTGKFNLDNVSVMVSVPDAGYTDMKTISISAFQRSQLTFSIPIPEAVVAGQHNLDVALTLPSGSSIVQNSKFTISKSSLTIEYSGLDTPTAGATISLTVENTGGVYTDFAYEITLIGNNITIYQNTFNDTLEAGVFKTYSFQIPNQAVSGSYLLYVDVLDKKTNKMAILNKDLTISGLLAGLSVKTDKDIYLSTEDITSLSTITSNAIGISDGNLDLKVTGLCSGTPPYFSIVGQVSGCYDTCICWEFGALYFNSEFTTQEFDTSSSTYQPYLPGYSIVFENHGTGYAFVDYIALRDTNGNIYLPILVAKNHEYGDYCSIVEGSNSKEITSEVSAIDGFAADVSDAYSFAATWDNIPSDATGLTVIMVAKQESNLTNECTLWETNVPVSQSPTTTNTINTLMGTLGVTGKLYLKGALTNNLAQTVASDEYPFYVIDGDFAFILSTDKKLYKPGETITIRGEIKNLSAIQADGINIELKGDISGSNLYTSTVNIPAESSYPFTITIIANTEGVYSIKGFAMQNNSVLTEVLEQYEVAMPKVSVTVLAPDVVGNEQFNLNLEIKNEGKIEAVVSLQSSVDSQIQNITIPAGETKLIQYQQQINTDTPYTFTFTGDFAQTITKTVSYGLAASITINSQPTYSEGTIAIPVTITNTGQLDETLTIDFRHQPSALIQTKTYFIQKGGIVSDTLYFELTEGNYQITASSQQPVVSSQGNFSVKKDFKVDMTVSVGAQSSSLIPVTVNLTNIGFSEFNGIVRLSVVSGQGSVVWNGTQIVSLTSNPQSPIPNPLVFNINPSSFEPGNYTLKAELLDNGGQQLAVSSEQLVIKGATFQLTQIPPSQTFTAGQETTFTFKVKNTGNQEGAVELSLNAYDLIDSTQTEWLSPQEEKSITFNFILPEDLEEKDYFADYELKGQGTGVKGQVKYHVSGINLNVNASLDKQYYNEGDTAHLTLQITDSRPQTSGLNLFARVNYIGYESQQTFTLNGTQTLAFDIPLTQITGEKLFYGIYYKSGRSIHLNSLYIYKAGDVITITTNKQVYNPSETVSVLVNSVSGPADGTMTLTAPNYSETFDFTGSATKSFTLPSTMTAGTYNISGQLSVVGGETYTATHPIDISGIQVKVKEATLDKSKYASVDTLKLNLTIESNRDMSATLKTWSVDPEGKYTLAGESSIMLSSSEPLLVTHNSSLVTVVSGIHRLVYAIYSGDLLLASGAEAFDVGDAVLLGLSTDKTDYSTNTESVIATVSSYGTIEASLEIQLDGTIFQMRALPLNGFTTMNIQLGTMQPGTHTLKAILTAGGLTSTKETTFTYAMSLLDSDSDGMPDEWEADNGLNPYDSNDALLDPDNDGLTNLQEYQNNTNPNNPDTDYDGMPDGWEVAYGLNPNVNDALSDKDNDGYSNLEEYQKGSNPNDPLSIPNQPPVANAGTDQNVSTGAIVTLNGSESYDPEGVLITFLWAFIEVPIGSSITDASLSDVTSAKPSFISDIDGNYKLKLVVNDGQMDSSPDEVIIISATPNVAPNANAGPDQNVYTGTVVNLNGSGSYDPDNKPQPLSYLWSFVSVPQGSALTDNDITDRTYAIAGFTPDVDGDYVIRLIVSDGDLSSNDSVVIISTRPNVPPNANAGADIAIYLGNTATLNGSLSNDSDNGPNPLTYSWRFVTVPTGSSITSSNLSNANTVSPFFVPDIVGTYVLELMVSDGEDYAFDNGAVTVTVSNLPDLIGQWTSMAIKQVTTTTGIQWVIYGNLQVTNQGNVNARSFVIKFYFIPSGGGSPQFLEQRSYIGLLKGATTNISFRKQYISNPSGTGSIRAVIDANNTVAESNEANNESTRSLP